jgi:hypothetical protein
MHRMIRDRYLCIDPRHGKAFVHYIILTYSTLQLEY